MAGSKPCEAGCTCGKHQRTRSPAQLAQLQRISRAGALARNAKHGNPAHSLSPEARERVREGARKSSRRIAPELRLDRGALSQPMTREKRWLATQPRRLSEKHRRKLSEANKRAWADPELRARSSEIQRRLDTPARRAARAAEWKAEKRREASLARGGTGEPRGYRRRRRRRTRLREQTVAYVDRFAIYERDGWTCQLCGEPVDPELKHGPIVNPRGHSLDHIVPLSRGGTHEPANVQLAHFECNSLKSDQLAA